MRGSSIMGVVSGGTVQFFTDKAETVVEAAASVDGREVQCIDVHGIWIMRESRVRWEKALVGLG